MLKPYAGALTKTLVTEAVEIDETNTPEEANSSNNNAAYQRVLQVPLQIKSTAHNQRMHWDDNPSNRMEIYPTIWNLQVTKEIATQIADLLDLRSNRPRNSP